MEELVLNRIAKEDREQIVELNNIIQENLLRKEFFAPVSNFILDNFYKDEKRIFSETIKNQKRSERSDL